MKLGISVQEPHDLSLNLVLTVALASWYRCHEMSQYLAAVALPLSHVKTSVTMSVHVEIVIRLQQTEKIEIKQSQQV